MDHKQLTALIRKTIKKAGIKALVRMQNGGGNSKIIQVNVSEWGFEFSENDQSFIRKLGVECGLTWVVGMPIDINEQTNPYTFNFYI